MPGELGEILWVSAKEALLMAFMVGILGSVAIGILSGICGDMVPSLPPGLDGHPALSSAPAHWWHASRNAIHRHSFAVLFFVLAALKAALRLAHYATDPFLRTAAARTLRVTRRFLRHWFSLLIKNALAAFVGVLVLQWSQNFTLTHWLWQALGNGIEQVIEAVAGQVGGGFGELVQRWFSWFGDNQTKFGFWLLFSAGLCDDLGLPNYKALARWGWRRCRHRLLPRISPAQP